MALVNSDPFRELERLTQNFWGMGSKNPMVPMDAFRKGDSFLLQFDLPGVESDAIDVTVEDNVLTVKATRNAPAPTDGVQRLVGERVFGTFSRQVVLGDQLDTENIVADFKAGVLTLSIPVAPHAKARKISIINRDHAELVGA